MTGYSLHVKSYDKKHTNIVKTSTGECLTATRGSRFCLIADNNTEHCTWVTVSIDGVCVGRWKLSPMSKLRIEDTKNASIFVFGSRVSAHSDPLVCETSTIEAEFEPAGLVVCIPVHICDHVVNSQ